MGLTRSQIDARLRELYDQIPAIPGCDGRCWTSCGPIDMSDRERQRIRQAGHKITPWQEARAWQDTYYCEALTSEKRCAVYELRPLVCRLWGAVEGMKCPFGCVPEGGLWLPDSEGLRLVIESCQIGGYPRTLGMPQGGALREAITNRWFTTEMERSMARGRVGEQIRIKENIPAAFRRPSGGA